MGMTNRVKGVWPRQLEKSIIEYVGLTCKPTNSIVDLNPFEKKIVKIIKPNISPVNLGGRLKMHDLFFSTCNYDLIKI